MVFRVPTLLATLFLIVLMALTGRALVTPVSAQENANVTAPRTAQQSAQGAERPSVAVPPGVVPRTAPGQFGSVPLQSVRPPVGATEGGEAASVPAGARPVGTPPGGINSPNANAENAAIWRAIREGTRGDVAGANDKAGILMVSGGEAWRSFRNGPLSTWSAVAILGTIGLLALFFALRGRMKVSHGLSGRRIKRFAWYERLAHWTLATSFIVLALTGLNLVFGRTLLMPLIGPEAFAAITLAGKVAHNYVGFAFMIALVAVALLWVWQNIPNRHDVVWLARGGGIIGHGHPPAKKFNAGQKIIFWVTIIAGISVSLSGWALLFPFSTTMFSDTFAFFNGLFGTSLPTTLSPLEEQQYQSAWHAIVSVFMTVVVIAHIYIGSVGMEGALDAMTKGDVDANWAKEHHALWVDEVEMERGIERRHAQSEGRMVAAE